MKKFQGQCEESGCLLDAERNSLFCTAHSRTAHSPAQQKHNSGQTWTPGDEATLIRWVKEGKALGEIASQLGRSPTAILARMQTIVEQRVLFQSLAGTIKDLP